MRLVFQGSPSECVEAFVAAARAFRDGDRLTPIVALVGSHWLRRQIRDRLHGAAGFWGLRLLTFRDLADRLGEPALLRAGRRPVSPHYQRALAARLLREQDGYFTPVREYDGAAQTFLSVFDDLEDAGWARWPVPAPAGGKLADAAALFNDYRATLSRRYFTPQDALAAADDAAGEFAGAFGADRLHVVGLYDVNPQQLRLLEKLAERLDVYCYVPQTVEPTPLTERLGVVASPPFAASPGSVKIFSCPSEMEEAKAIARAAAALRREGAAYREMAVLARQPRPYADLLVEACGRAGIPCRVAGGRTPLDAPSLRALQQLVGLIGSPLGRAEVMAFLTAVHLPGDDARRASQSLWARVSRAAMVKQGDDWDRRLGPWANADNLAREERQAAVHLREAAMALRDGLASIARAKTFGAAARALADAARNFIDADAKRDDALDGLAELGAIDDAGLPFDLAYFRARAAEIARRQKDDEAKGDRLTVLDWQAARGLRFRFVFVPGCVEGVVPLPPRQDPVLLNDEREALAVAADARGALPTTADRAGEERRLFDFVCRAADERLYFSFPRTDPANGRPRLPSHLLLGLASRLAGRTLTYDELPREAPLVEVLPAGRFAPASFAAALDDDERDLFAMNALAAVDPLAPVHYLLGARPAEFSRVWRRQTNRWGREGLTGHEGWCETRATGDALAKRAATRRSWSVSEMEDYVLCPRRYLFTRVLRLERPLDPEAVVSLPPDERGTLIHAALEALADAPHADVPATVDELYRTATAANLTGGGLLDEIERRRLAEYAAKMLEFIRAQSGGGTVATEEPVVRRLALPGGASIDLKGRLDRVETGERTRIVDYKTGAARSRFDNAKLKPDDFNAGSTMQLALYLLMWSEAHPAPKNAPLEAAYWYLKNHKGVVEPNAVEFGPDFLPARENDLRRALAAIFDDLRQGHFAPRPDLAANPANAYCGRCEFTVACDARGRARLAVKAKTNSWCAWLAVVGRFKDDED